MNNLLFSLNAIIPIFLIMILGGFLRKIKLLDDSFVTTLNKLNYQVTLPCMLFTDISQSDFMNVWDTKYVLFCFFVTLFCISVIFIGSKLFLKDTSLLGEFTQASYRGSAAILGIAFIQNIYGSATIAPLMIIGTVPLYNAAAVILLTLTNAEHTTLNRLTIKKTLLDVFTNPIIIGIILGIFVSLLHVSFPVIISKTLSSVSVLATPLALLALGASFEGKKALAKIKPTLISTFIKLILQPLCFLPLAAYFGFRDEKLVALLIMLGAPTTASCYIMAKNLKHEGVLSSSIIVTTTFFSSISFTLWLYLLKSNGLI